MKKTLTIFTILALTISTLVGCGKANEKLDTNEPKNIVTAEPTQNVEHTDVSENTTEPTETPDNRSEENPESGEVDLTGYLVDYPLTIGDSNIYVKLPEGFEFNPEANAGFYPTALEKYTDNGSLDVYKPSQDCNTEDIYIAYIPYNAAEWYLDQNGVEGDFCTYSTEVIDSFDNCIVYETSVIGKVETKKFYTLVYTEDNLNYSIMIYNVYRTCTVDENGNTLATPVTIDNTEEANSIVEFYKTNPLVIQ